MNGSRATATTVARDSVVPVPPPLEALPEAELVAGWDPAHGEEPWVSVVCMAFNHEATVRDAIEGILAQRTTFPFEVLVQDDASTDGTAAVIAPYAASHPHVVTALLREENLYSRNGMTLGNVLPLARGRWIAVVEADDYWSDPGKLAAQIEALQRTGAGLSLHPAVEVDIRRTSAVIAGELAQTSTLLPPGATLTIRTPPYAAAVYTRQALDRYAEFRDRANPPLGDVFMMAWGSLEGGIAYVDRPMSVYRRYVPGSWSSQHTADPVGAAQHGIRMIAALDALAHDAPSLRRAARARRRRVWWRLVWALRKALAAGRLTRREAWALWPNGHRAPVAVSVARVAVLVLPAKASGVLRSAARRLLGRR
jgi:glycosyltransferase involved in cell wall biosynthesis